MKKISVLYTVFCLPAVCFCIFGFFGCRGDSGPEGRHVFIDGGAHRGQTIRAFKKSGLWADHDWLIYAFECNPRLVHHLQEKYSARDNVKIIGKAMWIHNQGLEFYFGKTDLGGNVVDNRYTKKSLGKIHVASVDFGDWLKENFTTDDTIYVKLDIEGAEYAVLDKMFHDRTIRYVDQFFLEFHSTLMDGITEAKDRELLKKINGLGIPVETKESGSKEGEYFSEN